MLRLSFCALLLLAACGQTTTGNPCAEGCTSTIVEWEEGYDPAAE